MTARQPLLVLVIVSMSCGSEGGGDPIAAAPPPGETTPVGTLAGSLSVTDTGSARYEVPLWVPPGRRGMQPNLSLVYDSSRGSGISGVGWGLGGLSSIGRCSRTDAFDPDVDQQPHGFPREEGLCLDGQWLIGDPEGDYFATTEYRTELERFARIRRNGDVNDLDSWFEVRTKDGRIWTYGGTEDSNVMDSYQIHTWALRRVEDRFGNYMTIEYAFDSVSSYSNHRPSVIRYTGHGATEPERKVVFSYEPRSSDDAIYAFRRGNLTHRDVRLKRITGYGPDESRIRYYELLYGSPPAPEGSGRSLVVGIRECTGAGVCKPPTRFEYQPAEGLLTWNNAWNGHPYDLDDGNATDGVTRFYPMDANGDARDDVLVRRGGTYRVFTSTPGPFSPSDLAISSTDRVRVETADLSGNGTDDIIVYDKDGLRYHTTSASLNGGITVSAANVLASSKVADFAVADFNGDGLTDVMTCQYEADFDDCTFEAPECEYDEPDPVEGGAWDEPAEPQLYPGETEPGNTDPEPGVEPEGGGECAPPTCLQHEATWRISVGGDYFGDFEDTGIACSERCSYLYGCKERVGWILNDFDGDGSMNLLQIRKLPDVDDADVGPSLAEHPRYRALVNRGSGWSVEETTLPADLYQRYRLGRSGRGVDKMADVNGDGLVDIVRFEPGDDTPPVDTLYDWDSSFTGACTEDKTPEQGVARIYLNTGTEYRRVLGPLAMFERRDSLCEEFLRSPLLDYDGDGRTDMLTPYVIDEGVLSVSRTQLPLAAETKPTSLSLDRRDAPLRAVDVKGNGEHGLTMWTGAPNATLGSWRILFRQHRPELLVRVEDGLGAATRLEYSSLSDDEVYSDDGGGIELPHDWRRSRMAVVSRVSNDTTLNTHDHITEYHYHRLVRNTRRGGFLGFAQRSLVERYGIGDPFRRRIIEFDNGTIADDTGLAPYAMRPLSTTTYTTLADAGRYYVARQEWVYEAAPTPWGGSFVYAGAGGYREWDIAGDCDVETLEGCATLAELEGMAPLESRSWEQTMAAYGLPEWIATDDGDGFETYMEWSYTHDEAEWLVGLPETVQLRWYGPDGEVLGVDRTYDYVPSKGVLQYSTVRDIDNPDSWFETEYAFDDYGNIERLFQYGDDGLGGDEPTRSFETYYDSEGLFPIRRVNPLGHELHIVWDEGLGVATRTYDQDGLSAQVAYDDFGRMTRMWRTAAPNGPSDGGDVTQRYERVDAPTDPEQPSRVRIVIERAEGTWARVEHDRFGREARREWNGFDGSEIYTQTTYAPQGYVQSRSAPAIVGNQPESWWSFEVDELGRPVEAQDAHGATTRWEYFGNTVRVTDPRNHVWVERSDRQGRLKESVDPYGTTVCHYYGPAGHPRSVWLNGGRCSGPVPTGPVPAPSESSYVVETSTDAFGNVVEIDDPNLGRRGYAFNAFGELKLEVDGNSQLVHYEVDELGRVVSRYDADGTTSWEYDQHDGYGRNGSLAGSTSPDGVETRYFYDDFGRDAGAVTTIDGESFLTSIDYDDHSRLALIHYPSALGDEFSVRYEYNAQGHLAEVSNGNTGATYWTRLDVHPAGMTELERYGNGVYTRSTFEKLRLEKLETGANLAQPGSLHQNLEYGYAANGNVVQVHDAVNGQVEYFVYDRVNRVTDTYLFSFDENTPVYEGGHTIEYGPLGSIRHRTGIGDYEYDGPFPTAVTAANGVSFEYDGNGNQVTRGNSTWEYTSFDKPRSADTSEGHFDFYYDAEQELVRRTNGNTEVFTVGGLFRRERTKGATLSVEDDFFVHADGRVVARVRRTPGLFGVTEQVRYMHPDRRGSTDVVTRADGKIAQRMSYGVFGEKRNPIWSEPGEYTNKSDLDLGFTGHREQQIDGLVDMGGRYYDPVLGRFTGADPLAHPEQSTQGYDRFSYVYNNPLGYTDPTGFDGVDDDAQYVPGETRYIVVRTEPGPPRNAVWSIDNKCVEVELSSLPITDMGDFAADPDAWEIAMDVGKGLGDALLEASIEQVDEYMVRRGGVIGTTYTIYRGYQLVTTSYDTITTHPDGWEMGVLQVVVDNTFLSNAQGLYEGIRDGDVRKTTSNLALLARDAYKARVGGKFRAKVSSWFGNKGNGKGGFGPKKAPDRGTPKSAADASRTAQSGSKSTADKPFLRSKWKHIKRLALQPFKQRRALAGHLNQTRPDPSMTARGRRKIENSMLDREATRNGAPVSGP